MSFLRDGNILLIRGEQRGRRGKREKEREAKGFRLARPLLPSLDQAPPPRGEHVLSHPGPCHGWSQRPSSHPQNTLALILWRSKLRHREVKRFAQDHTAHKRPSRIPHVLYFPWPPSSVSLPRSSPSTEVGRWAGGGNTHPQAGREQQRPSQVCWGGACPWEQRRQMTEPRAAQAAPSPRPGQPAEVYTLQ